MAENIEKWFGHKYVDIGIKIIVLVLILFCAYLFVGQGRIVECQTVYNQLYSESATASRQARDQDDEVRDNLFRAIYEARKRNNAETQRDIDNAFVEYFTTRELTDKQRALNPPPPQPENFCA